MGLVNHNLFFFNGKTLTQLLLNHLAVLNILELVVWQEDHML
jgi:hypothetical protein